MASVKSGFEEAFARAWRGEIENDDFNRLVLRANLGWREVAILRAYRKYLRQIGFTFSQAYTEQALSANPAIAKKLVELFVTRFDPAQTAEAELKTSEMTSKSGQHWTRSKTSTKTASCDRFLCSDPGDAPH